MECNNSVKHENQYKTGLREALHYQKLSILACLPFSFDHFFHCCSTFRLILLKDKNEMTNPAVAAGIHHQAAGATQAVAEDPERGSWIFLLYAN